MGPPVLQVSEGLPPKRPRLLISAIIAFSLIRRPVIRVDQWSPDMGSNQMVKKPIRLPPTMSLKIWSPTITHSCGWAPKSRSAFLKGDDSGFLLKKKPGTTWGISSSRARRWSRLTLGPGMMTLLIRQIPSTLPDALTSSKQALTDSPIS